MILIVYTNLLIIINKNEKNEVSNQMILADEESNKEKHAAKIIKIYKEFLEGKRKAKNGDDIDSLTVPKGEPDKRYNTTYAFFDSNGDGDPELHINSSHYYTIYTVKDDELTVWKDLSPSPYYYALKNGAFISYKPGGAPMYDIYTYYVYNFTGDEIWKNTFSCYDVNQNTIYDENDEYYFDDVEVTKKQWDGLTARYLFLDSEGHMNIRIEIEWISLYKE